MGIFARIRGLFCSCIRPSTSTANNEENSRFLGQSGNSPIIQVASTSTGGLNNGQVSHDCSAEFSINKASTSHHVKDTETTTRQPITKASYCLQTFVCSLKNSLSRKGKASFAQASDVVYQNEWTECTAVILDECSHRISSQHIVELSSDSNVKFRDCKLQNGFLQFSMKALNAETITIFFNIEKHPDRFTLSKKVQVRCNPSSSVQAEMTIKTIKESSAFKECVFQVSVVDLLGVMASPDSCRLEILSSGEDKVIETKRDFYSEAGQIYFEVTVRGQKPWSSDFVLTLNGQPVATCYVKKIEVFGKLKELCCRALKNNDIKSIPDFIEFYASQVFLPLSVGKDDGKFLPYNENDCVLQPASILCKNATKDEISGPDFAHIRNIARALELKHPPDVLEVPAENIVLIDLTYVHQNRHCMGQEMLHYLLCGLYYRKKASEAGAVRMEWKRRISTLCNLIGQDPSIKVCRILRDHFGNLMNHYNREACEALFTFFNFRRNVCEVDLHGLYVADEKKLQLLRSERGEKLDDLIKKFRDEGDEAIRKLEVTLESFDLEKAIKNNTPWLEIIVGAGRHSKIKNKQSIRPKVEKLLKERKLNFAPVNKGSLVVTFLAYNGPEPCFGEYYCARCDLPWKSSKSYIGKFQQCARCKNNCWPLKQRQNWKVANHPHYGARPGKPKRQSNAHQRHRARQELRRQRVPSSEEECIII